MLVSATVVNNAKLKAQQGFSLIELLVVVAIIGVLAAAGIVGYQSYLDGVKKDTQKNNVLSIARALELAAPARSGELSGVPEDCSRSAMKTSASAALSAPTAALALACVKSALGGDTSFDKFSNPFDQTKKGGDYILEGGSTTSTVLSKPGAQNFGADCDKTAASFGSIYVHTNTIAASGAIKKDTLEIILEPCGSGGAPMASLFASGADARVIEFD